MSRRVRGDDTVAGRCEREEAPGVREGDGRRPEGAAAVWSGREISEGGSAS